jgi:WD40 repeat protein
MLLNICFNPDGKAVATVHRSITGSYRIARLWDSATARELEPSAAENKWLDNLPSAYDEGLVNVRVDGRRITVTNTSDGSLVGTFEIVDDRWTNVQSVTFSPDRSRIALGTAHDHRRGLVRNSHALLVYGVRGEGCMQLDHPNLGVTGRFTDDGRYIVTSCLLDDVIRVWHSRTGDLERSLAHPDEVTDLCVIPRSHVAVTGCRDGFVRLWDARTGVQLAALKHDAMVLSVAVSPDGSRLATGSLDKTARLWDLVPAD